MREAGIDTSYTLLEAMTTRREEGGNDYDEEEGEEGSTKGRETLESPFLLEPLLVLTERLTQQGAASRLEKWDVARQLFFSGELAIIQQQQAIK